MVIEDEKKLASFVRKGLEARGGVVEVSHHRDEGFTLASTQPYDAAILDMMLPGRDGLSILRNLRERKNPLPVILLTARSELKERLEGLNLGARDRSRPRWRVVARGMPGGVDQFSGGLGAGFGRAGSGC